MVHFIVTGASGGIGRAFCHEAFEDEEVVVHGVSRTDPKFHQENFSFYETDLSDVKGSLETAKKISGFVEDASSLVLLNSVGTLGQTEYFGNLDIDSLENAFALNALSPIAWSDFWVREADRRRVPLTVITISSGAGTNPYDGWAAYCSTKASVNLSMKVLERESQIRQNAVRAFAVAPGVVDTKMVDEVLAIDPRSFSRHQKFQGLKDDGELAKPEEVAQKLHYVVRHRDYFETPYIDLREVDLMGC